MGDSGFDFEDFRHSKRLDQKQLFQAVFAAIIAAIFLCWLIYYNLILLGEFLFVTVIAGVTSLWLRQVKGKIVDSIEKAFVQEFFFVRSSSIFKLFEKFLIPMIRKRSLVTLIDQARYHYNWVKVERTKAKKTVFNNEYDAFLILAIYIGLTRFGWQATLQMYPVLSSSYFAAMLLMDLTIIIVKQCGLADYTLIEAKTGKLRSTALPKIQNAIMLGFVVALPVIASIMTTLLLIDLGKLKSVIVINLSQIDTATIPQKFEDLVGYKID